MFVVTELHEESQEAEYDASKEWKNGIGTVRHVVDVEPFAYYDICRIAYEEDHTGGIRSWEFGDNPSRFVELQFLDIICKERSTGEDYRVVSNNHAYACQQDVEIDEDRATTRPAFITDPMGGSLENARNVQRNGEVSERKKQYDDIVWFYAFWTDYPSTDYTGSKALCSP